MAKKKRAFQGHFVPEQNVFAWFNCKFMRVSWSPFELKDFS